MKVTFVIVLLLSTLSCHVALSAEVPRDFQTSATRVGLRVSCSSTDFQEIDLVGTGQLLFVGMGQTIERVVEREDVEYVVSELLGSTFPYLPERVEELIYSSNDSGQMTRVIVEVTDDCSASLTMSIPGYFKKVEYSSRALAPQTVVRHLQKLALGIKDDS